MTEPTKNKINVLHVDDEPDFADLAATYLEREEDRINVRTTTSPQTGLEILQEHEIDCIVSDYDMPKSNGLEFLEAVRKQHPDLPFILYTGKGSEEVASDAISAGVTDYLQKETGTGQYAVLANRIENAVEQNRTQQQIEETRTWYETILKHSSDYVMVVDGNGVVQYVTPPIEQVMGYNASELVGEDSLEFVHPDDLEEAMEALSVIATEPEQEQSVEYRAQHADGTWRWLSVRGRNLLDHPIVEGVLVNVRDITKRKKREQDLEAQKNRLEDLTSFLSHDLKNQLMLVESRIDMLKKEFEDENLEKAKQTTKRMAAMIDGFTELSKKGRIPTTTEPIRVESAVDECWNRLPTDAAEIEVKEDFTVEADRTQFLSLFENLLQNAITHAGPDVSIRIGLLDKGAGFYLEDDGPGIPSAQNDPGKFFDPGFSTDDEGEGFGLAFVKHIADAHGWDVELIEGNMGGVRFEFSNMNISS